MIEFDKETRRQLMMIRNIIKDGDGYKLQNNYYMDGDELKWVVSCRNQDNHRCELCPHFRELSGGNGCCDILNELFGLEPNAFAWSGLVLNCAAYDPVNRLNIINSMDEMVAFIVKVKNFFKNFESYEAYFGFHLAWDEETGENLETVEDYYKRGGEFANAPTQYPSVICFDRSAEEDLDWIYIGE